MRELIDQWSKTQYTLKKYKFDSVPRSGIQIEYIMSIRAW